MWPHGSAYLLLAGRPSADWPLSSLLWRSALLTTATGPRLHWRDIWTSGHPAICNTYWPIGQLTKFGRFCLNYDLPRASARAFYAALVPRVQRSGPLHRSPWCRKSLVPRSWSWAGLGLVTENWSYSRPGPDTVSPLPTSCPASEWLMTIVIYFKVLVKCMCASVMHFYFQRVRRGYGGTIICTNIN